MKSKSVAVYVITIVLAVLFILAGYHVFKGFPIDSEAGMTVYRAKVISVDGFREELDFDRNIVKTVAFTAEIREGAEKGTAVSCTQEVGGSYAAPEKEVSGGDSIFVYYDEYTQPEEWRFAGYNRISALVVLCAAFLAAIVLIGRAKGVSTVLSLTFTCLAIFLVYIPSILNGMNVYLSTIMAGAYIIVISLILINGPGPKTLCAVFGNIGGVLVAALLASFMNKILHMTGFFISEEMMFLFFLQSGQTLNLAGIAWGGMVLGSLGAIMDVAMSIASSMHELSEHMSEKSFSKMFGSGMNIGRDAIGTMTTTLILAYIGSSLALVLLLMVQSGNIHFLFSMEMIAVEIVQAVTGSMGILFAVPLTAFFSAYVYCKRK